MKEVKDLLSLPAGIFNKYIVAATFTHIKVLFLSKSKILELIR